MPVAALLSTLVAIGVLVDARTTALVVAATLLLATLLPHASNTHPPLRRRETVEGGGETSSLVHGLMLLLPFSLLLFREFEGLDGPRSRLYGAIPTLSGFRLIDLIVLSVGGLALLGRATRRCTTATRIPRRILLALGSFGVAVVIAITYGVSRGGTEVFFDWRNAFLGTVVAFAAVSVLRNARAALLATYVLLFVIGAKSLFLLARFLVGWSSVRAFSDHPIPTFDGPTLQAGVLSALLALSLLCHVPSQSRGLRTLSLVTLVSSSLLVVVAMRRTYWGQMGIGLAILLMGLPGRLRAKLAIVAVSGALLVLAGLDPNVLTGRLHSLLVFSDSKSPYAATNNDHVNDVLDAWDVIVASPLLGNGLGRPYQTDRIKGWKSDSWGVHNGPLHVWIGYGLLGIVSYAFLHAYLFGWLWRQGKESTSASGRGIARGVFASWVGAFTMSLGFSPWPYGALQTTMLLGTCFALVAASSKAAPLRRKRQNYAPMPT